MPLWSRSVLLVALLWLLLACHDAADAPSEDVASGESVGGSSGGTGGAGGNRASSGPVDCSPIADHEGWELCDAGYDSCAAVFRDGAGCAAVCAAAGLTCSRTLEDLAGTCASDPALPALWCGQTTGNESDYCVCVDLERRRSGAGAGMGGGGLGGAGPDVTLCDPISDYGIVEATIVVESGETFDGGCQRFVAGSALGDGSQLEGQEPVFVVEQGGVLRNVVLGRPAADGIHTRGDVELFNVHWEDVGEDALTVEAPGVVSIDGGSAHDATDKIFQINAPGTFSVTNFVAKNGGKFIRQNGGTDFKTDVFIHRCDISDMVEAIFRTDSSSSTVTMTDTRYGDVGQLFVGVAMGNVTASGNTEY